MRELAIGMPALSMAGHDRGKIYVIIRETDEYVYLVDGITKTAEKPKKKKKKHIQVTKTVLPLISMELEKNSEISNEIIKRALKEWKCCL